jgi:hypothetical protein
MKQLIGIMMVGSVLAAIFAAIWASSGLLPAIGVFGVAIACTGIILMGIFLACS